MYTCVPRQIREDMEWMAAIGTNFVCVGVLEQDLFAAPKTTRSSPGKPPGWECALSRSRAGGAG